jgi:hypothetical protein
MGLEGACSDLRKIAEDQRRRFEEADLAGSLGEVERSDVLQRFVRAGLGQISERCGDIFARELLAWAEAIFPTERHSITQAFLWTQILRNAGRKGDESLASLKISPDKKERILSSIVDEIVNKRNVHAVLKGVEASPKSLWDAKKFAEYTEGASPLDLVKEAVLRWRFFRLWGKIGSILSQPEIRELLSWAKGEAGPMGMPADLLDIP